MIELAKLPKDQWLGTAAIAKKIKAPSNYLGKTLQYLVAQGIVVSQKGSGGGFRLSRQPECISIYDVVSNLEDVDVWTRCALGLKKCSDHSPCAAHEQWGIVRDKYLDFLKKTTFADLLK